MTDPVALRTVERQFLAIHGEKILTKEFPQFAKDVPKPAQHRIVAPNGVLCLQPIDNEEYDHRQKDAETKNLAESEPEQAKKLVGQLDQIMGR